MVWAVRSPREAGKDSMDGEFHAESESGIGSCVRGFAGDRRCFKVGQMQVGGSETAELELLV